MVHYITLAAFWTILLHQTIKFALLGGKSVLFFLLREIAPEQLQNFLCGYSCKRWCPSRRISCASEALPTAEGWFTGQVTKLYSWLKVKGIHTIRKKLPSWMKVYMCKFVCKKCCTNGRTTICHRKVKVNLVKSFSS